jgi:hypothetical protein
MGLKQEVLDAIVERRVLAKVGERMGLAAIKEDAEELTADGHVIVLGNTYDWLGDGAFNYEMFKLRHLPRFMVTEPKYLEYQRQELLARTVRDLIASTLTISEAELRAEYEGRQNQLSLRYARFEAARFSDLVDPSDAEITKYVEAHKDELVKQFESQGVRFTKLPKQVRLRFMQVQKAGPAGRGRRQGAQGRVRRGAQGGAREDRRGDGEADGGRGLRAVARCGVGGRDDGPARRRVRVDERRGHGLGPRPDHRHDGGGAQGGRALAGGRERGGVLRRARRGGARGRRGAGGRAARAGRGGRGARARQGAGEAGRGGGVAGAQGRQEADGAVRGPGRARQDAPGIEALAVAGEATPPKGDVGDQPELRVTGLFARERPIPGLGMNPS